jgi:integrase
MASITRQKKDGVYYLIDYIKGKQKWIRLGKITKSEARKVLSRYEQDKTYLRLDIELPPSEISLFELTVDYLDSLLGYHAESTIKINRLLINSFLKLDSSHEAVGFMFVGVAKKYKQVGDFMINMIDSNIVLKYCYLKNYKPNTIRLLSAFLKKMYDYAIEKKYISINPFENFKRPKVEELPPKYVDPDLLSRTIDAMTGHIKLYFMILYYTGMRPSEALRLKVEDIVDNHFVIKKSKTKRFRTVPVNENLKLNLAEHIKDKANDDYLFPGKIEGHQKEMKNGLSRALKRAGIKEKISPYSFRHTFATYVLKNTADLRAVQTLLGHSNSKMTERYAHSLPQTLIDAVHRMPDYKQKSD